jgi:peptide/nickel transport system substrate-binding protein
MWKIARVFFLLALSLIILTGCQTDNPRSTATVEQTALPSVFPTDTPTPTTVAPRVLTVCMGQEPDSLFIYNDGSTAARSLRQAIYDGPFDPLDYKNVPVILEREPSLANQAIRIEQVSAAPGDLIVGADGSLKKLAEGVEFYPSGCRNADCLQTYSGQGEVQIDQMVVQFNLRPDIYWSDGNQLTMDDSVYSYEIARSLYPRVRPELLAHTISYQAVDELTLEWRGLAGYLDPGAAGFFFHPLPRHTWSFLPVEELMTSDIANRMPVGWGPYVIEEWVAGDHISLNRNPGYFRAGEGLPKFDHLVYRFMRDSAQALSALQAGECDYVDESAHIETEMDQVLALQQSGDLKSAITNATAWEHLDFGIQAYQDPSSSVALPIPWFGLKETRQAVAQCVDRQAIVNALFPALSSDGTQIPDSYIPLDHPLYAGEVETYRYDPQAAASLLESVGWVDEDGNPDTPRVGRGIAGIPEGTPFRPTLIIADDPEKQQLAELLSVSLARCGIQIEVQTGSLDTLFAPGPDGPVFGRRFDLAQFGWSSSIEPPCFLYTSTEIPGPYPQYPKGWGGANASGYANSEFDRACGLSRQTLPEMPEYQQAHVRAQILFSQELPALPLYWRQKMVAMRPDFCGVQVTPAADSALWNVELFDYGEECK